MKKLIYILFLFSIITSCDYILKKHKDTLSSKDSIPKLGIVIEKDKNGCDTETGYKWSKIFDGCIRVIEEGFRLNPINNLTNLEPTKSAYVVLDDKKLQAEVFLQENTSAIYFKRNSINDDFIEKEYKLSLKNGFSFLKKDSVMYLAAQTIDKSFIKTDAQ